MNIERTPTPWNVDPDSIIDGPDGSMLGATERYTDAEFIVRACNAHDELVAALIQALGSCCPECLFMLADEGSGHPPECSIGIVLAKARGE